METNENPIGSATDTVLILATVHFLVHLLVSERVRASRTENRTTNGYQWLQ